MPCLASAVGGEFFAPDFPRGRAGIVDVYPTLGGGVRPNINQFLIDVGHFDQLLIVFTIHICIIYKQVYLNTKI